MTVAPRIASPRELFAHRDFAALWIAGSQSQIGDQLARVALSVLVFERTGSNLATAATYALTYLPAVVGGILLTGLADRRPRRALLVTCDLVRAALFGVMSLPGLPLGVLSVLLVIAVLAGSPYQAAEPAVVADMFEGPRYAMAQGIRSATSQTAQLIGFLVGGVVVAAAGARLALAIDAATFVASAILLRFGLTRRPATAPGARRGIDQIKSALHVLVGTPRLRVLIALTWLYACWIVPEGLAAPYSAHHGGGPASVGVLLAAAPIGSVIGVVVLTRWVPLERRSQMIGLFAALSGVPLVACGFNPPIPVAAVLWGLCGMCTAYLVLIITEFVALVPGEIRGQAIGLASSGLLAAQGIGLLIGGAISSAWSVPMTIAVAGGVGSLLAIPLAMRWRTDATTLREPTQN